MKIVINECYGGFRLNREIYKCLGLKWDGAGYAYDEYSKRTDPKLVECVEKYIKEHTDANGKIHTCLRIVEIPDDVEWEIEEYDGNEWVSEKHRTWS